MLVLFMMVLVLIYAMLPLGTVTGGLVDVILFLVVYSMFVVVVLVGLLVVLVTMFVLMLGRCLL